VEKLATLKTSFRDDGKLTAGNSSQISDGAALLLLMSGAAVDRLRVKPRARIRAFTTVGSDPTLMLTGPVAATRKVLEKAGLGVEDIDLFEVNEAFASVPLMWAQELGVSHDKLNVNGGAIALGHPLGASGARIMTSLLHELERRGARYGLQAICCAGGMGTATLIERI
jgi:acetyl-CoA acyltransferase